MKKLILTLLLALVIPTQSSVFGSEDERPTSEESHTGDDDCGGDESDSETSESQE